MKFEYTLHALDRMLKRAIPKVQVEKTVMKGMKFGPDKEGNMHARMGYVEVVFRRKGDRVRIITVMEVGR